MSAELQPTKARVALLAAIAAGDVYADVGVGGGYSGHDYIIEDGRHYRVTNRVNQVLRAGWVQWRNDESGNGRYLLTPTGKAVLDAHTEATS